MSQIASEIILVADSSKFGKRSLSQIVPISRIDTIITDEGLETETRKELTALGVQVIAV
jgi:DeoR family transcriptional regulator of aga operon